MLLQQTFATPLRNSPCCQWCWDWRGTCRHLWAPQVLSWAWIEWSHLVWQWLPLQHSVKTSLRWSRPLATTSIWQWWMVGIRNIAWFCISKVSGLRLPRRSSRRHGKQTREAFQKIWYFFIKLSNLIQTIRMTHLTSLLSRANFVSYMSSDTKRTWHSVVALLVDVMLVWNCRVHSADKSRRCRMRIVKMSNLRMGLQQKELRQ